MTRAVIALPLASSLALTVLSGCALTPTALTEEEITAKATASITRITAAQEPVSRPIDLYEAMARALKYNLDHRVEMMEAALRTRELDLAHLAMLPSVVANSGYAGRDNFNASNSVNVLTGVESLATSTSQEKRIRTADIAFSWNILDFGLSYIRARQAGDRYLIAEEMRRKVAARIIEDVRTAYWRAVSADRLISRLAALEQRVRRAQQASRSISADRQTSPITAATYERELVEIKRTVQELQRELAVSRTQLSSLMNLRPGTRFTLVHAGGARGALRLTMPVPEMIRTALTSRSELREVWYRQRINEQELHAAFLELLPGIQLYAGSNYDSNDFLYNNHWVSWGAKASTNLIRIFQLPARRAVIEAQDRVLDERSLAITMAIMTQVHVARVRFHHYRRELATGTEFLDVQRRLVGLMRVEADASRISEQTLIREEMNLLVAEVKRDIAFAGLQNAFANVYASMGLDPYGQGLDLSRDVRTIARALRLTWLERGDIAGAPRARIAAAH